LVPQNPFSRRDIATGVCLIVFSAGVGVISGIVGFGIGFIFGGCLECTPYCLETCYYNICDFIESRRNKKNVNKVVTGIPVPIESV
jgi:hypothetical protein